MNGCKVSKLQVLNASKSVRDKFFSYQSANDIDDRLNMNLNYKPIEINYLDLGRLTVVIRESEETNTSAHNRLTIITI